MFTYFSIKLADELYLADFFPSSLQPPLTIGGASSPSLGDCTSLLLARLPCLAGGCKQIFKTCYIAHKNITLDPAIRSISESQFMI